MREVLSFLRFGRVLKWCWFLICGLVTCDHLWNGYLFNRMKLWTDVIVWRQFRVIVRNVQSQANVFEQKFVDNIMWMKENYFSAKIYYFRQLRLDRWGQETWRGLRQPARGVYMLYTRGWALSIEKMSNANAFMIERVNYSNQSHLSGS